jgi:hypothetical protein
MVDRVIKAVKKGRGDMWDAFKKSISITGYKYYEPPEGIKYRFPAPGSCSLDVKDHPHLYKNDWKTPFRASDYNISKKEWAYEDEDPRQALNYVGHLPKLSDESHKRNYKYDKANVIDEITYDERLLIVDDPNKDWASPESRGELWQIFEAQADKVKEDIRDFNPGNNDYDDDYNQVNQIWHNRGVTGFENLPRFKEIFVEMEYWIEEVVGKP